MTAGHRQSDTVLALDPSSTICGFGLLRMDSQLLQHGLITPACASDGSFDRIMGMAQDLLVLLGDTRPAVVLVEWTKGKVNTRRHGGLGAGLAVYGCGVGALALAAHFWCGDNGSRLDAVLENDWTRGVAKSQRQLAIAQLYPQYIVADDSGGDASDAIGLAIWWLRERRTQLALPFIEAFTTEQGMMDRS